MKLQLRVQKNANRDYFYPDCDTSRALLKLMKRSALVSNDREKLEALAESMGSTLELDIQQREAPSL